MHLSRPARAFIAIVAAAGVAADVFAVLHVPAQRVAWLLPLVALVVLGSQLSSVSFRWVELSLTVVLVIAALVLVGLPGMVIVATVGGFGSRDRTVAIAKRIFNMGQLALAAIAAGALYQWLGGPVGSLDEGNFPGVIGLVLLATAAYFIVSDLLLASVISLTQSVRWLSIFRSGLTLVFPYVAYGLIGLLMAVLWVDYTPVSALLLFMPLFAARWALQQHADQHKAYDATLRALITTIEVKDGYTRGHSERVSKIATMIARESHMGEDRVEAVRYAALLHDVGKTGIASRILGKHGKLTEDEFDVIKTHPDRGVQMLEGIDFLMDSISGVYHHHERMDGGGYPLGLVGAEIPVIARIVMVADAFDAMTSTRSYRPARSTDKAVAELRRCQGDQFDPQMVDALVRAVDKQGWQGDPEPFQPDSDAGIPAPAPVAASSTQAHVIPYVRR